jgi:hypothetical protein
MSTNEIRQNTRLRLNTENRVKKIKHRDLQPDLYTLVKAILKSSIESVTGRATSLQKNFIRFWVWRNFAISKWRLSPDSDERPLYLWSESSFDGYDGPSDGWPDRWICVTCTLPGLIWGTNWNFPTVPDFFTENANNLIALELSVKLPFVRCRFFTYVATASRVSVFFNFRS